MPVVSYVHRQQSGDKLTGRVQMLPGVSGQRLPETEFVTPYGQQERRWRRVLFYLLKH